MTLGARRTAIVAAITAIEWTDAALKPESPVQPWWRNIMTAAEVTGAVDRRRYQRAPGQGRHRRWPRALGFLDLLAFVTTGASTELTAQPEKTAAGELVHSLPLIYDAARASASARAPSPPALPRVALVRPRVAPQPPPPPPPPPQIVPLSSPLRSPVALPPTDPAAAAVHGLLLTSVSVCRQREEKRSLFSPAALAVAVSANSVAVVLDSVAVVVDAGRTPLFQHGLLAIDINTSVVEITPMKGHTAADVEKALEDGWLRKWPTPKAWQSDNAQELIDRHSHAEARDALRHSA